MITVKTFGSAFDLEKYMNEHRIGWTEDGVCLFQVTHSNTNSADSMGLYTLIHY